MGENSKIEWCDHTWNPWIGCTKVSPACDHCYAETFVSGRMGKPELWQGQRHRTAPSTWRQPLAWNRKAAKDGRRARVFCASLADVFDNQVPGEWRADLWQLILATPNLDWLLLTKRPQNLARMLPCHFKRDLPNAWLGTTVENQEEAERRIPHLLASHASVHFLSCEPLLGPIDLTRIPMPHDGGRVMSALHGHEIAGMVGNCVGWIPQIDWIICGGESGPGARPMHPDWARSLRDQCKAAGVPFLFKQWGEWGPDTGPHADGSDPVMDGTRCATWSDSGWHYYDNGYQPPTDGDLEWMYRFGKKRAGRLLDGVTHDQSPDTE